jgi:hypothetical protein
MSVVINGTGSISGLSNVGGISSAQSGSIIQTVNVTYSTQTSNSSGGVWADTGLTASITPQFSTSKILVTWMLNGVYCSNGIGMETNLLRGASQIVYTENLAAREGSGAVDAGSGTSGGTYLDSPATTSSTTYKCQFRPRSGSSAVTVQFTGTGGASTSMITLMEIAQ